MADTRTRLVNEHYGRRDDLGELILAGLRAAGKDPAAPVPEDLAPVDQFHIRGRDATLELARLAGLRPGQQVVDVGGGIGGPARTLASQLGSRVTVLDLTEAFCRVGQDLTARTGLGDRVRFRHGDALEMPFGAGEFDVAWTQHSSMNIEDKPRLYREIHRVLGPGGRFAFHEVMAGPGGPVHFPVPWARDPTVSFLRPPAEIRALVAAAGFRELAWEDVSAPALAWFRERVAALATLSAPPPLGLHLILGPDAGPMFRSVLKNLEEARVLVVQAVFDRP